MRLILSWISIFDWAQLDLDFSPKEKSLDLTDLNQKLISMKELVAYEVHQKFYEIGTFEGIADLELHLKSK